MNADEAAFVPLLEGEYRYAVHRDGRIVATEEERLAANQLTGVRRPAEGGDRHEVEAILDGRGLVTRLVVRYSRGPFSRSAAFEATGEFMRGTVNTLTSRENVFVKLGRFREVDGDIILFKALIIAHARGRAQTRFTGRVAAIDSNTLMMALHKQSYRQIDAEGLLWSYEPRMGDSETIEIDRRGMVVCRVDSRGDRTVLVSAKLARESPPLTSVKS